MADKPTSQSDKTNTNDQTSNLKIAATNRTPEVVVDFGEGLISIKGCSMPANVNQFYAPVLERLDHYLQKPAKQTRVVFSLDYINSSSSQLILAILFKLKALVDKGYHLTVEWHYMFEDEDIYETGKSYSELSGITFNFYEHE
jgi:hypothetical protein